MSRANKPRETRKKVKKREEEEYLTKQSMSEEEEQTPVWAQNLSAQIASLDSSFQQKLQELNTSTKEIKKELRAMVNRVGNAEKCIADLEDKNTTQETALADLTKETSTLKSKLSYLESQSRRNNLIIVGLDEGLFERNADQELAALLRYILDRGDHDAAPETERHHRAPRPRPGTSEPPRPYIVKMLRWNDRQLLLRAAANNKNLSWKGKTFTIFPDLPADTQQKRLEYGDIKKKLREAGIRYGILFPARLIVTVNGQKYIYKTPDEAIKELPRRLPSAFG